MKYLFNLERVMRLSWCPSCHSRYRNGETKCEVCGSRTRWVIACPRCGDQFTNNNFKRHKKSCERIPRPDKLADLFDNDPTVTTWALAGLYGVNSRAIERRLAGTRWSGQRLRERGRMVRANKYRELHGSELRPTTPCRRCFILGQSLDDDGLCEWCLDDIRGTYNRLALAVTLERYGYSLGRGHWLNAWDIEYFTRQATA